MINGGLSPHTPLTVFRLYIQPYQTEVIPRGKHLLGPPGFKPRTPAGQSTTRTKSLNVNQTVSLLGMHCHYKTFQEIILRQIDSKNLVEISCAW